MEKSRGLVLVPIVVALIGFGSLAHAQEVGVTLPSVPTGMTATMASPSQVSVSWSASTESSGTIEGYYVYRNGQEFTATAGLSLVDSGLIPGVYFYTVAAYDANGNVSTQASPASVTLVADTSPPSVPAGVTVSGTTSTNSYFNQVPLTISWSPSTDNIGVAGYYVYRNGTNIVSSTSAFTGTSITDMVTPGTYTYTVDAYDAAQNVSDKSVPVTVTISVDNNPPSTPTHLSAQQVSASGVNLTWYASTDSIGVAGYQIYRDGTQIASAAGSPYSDTGLATNITYSYSVAAYDAAGNASYQSAPITITVQPVSGLGPPYILSAIFLGTSTINLSWVPPADPLAITGYAVYRNGTQVASVTSTSYLDEGLATGTYAYSLTATDISGTTSPMSSSTNVLVPVVTTPITFAPPSPAAPVNTEPSGPSTSTSTTSFVFTQSLYFGLRSTQVEALQSFLVQYGYLAAVDETGFFGNLTLHAVQKFQCSENIVCTNGPGWGIVGPKTRSVLNNFQGNSTTADLDAQIQALQAELVNLEHETF